MEKRDSGAEISDVLLLYLVGTRRVLSVHVCTYYRKFKKTTVGSPLRESLGKVVFPLKVADRKI